MWGIRSVACSVSLICLVACGIQETNTERSSLPGVSTTSSSSQIPKKVVAIGNSITFHFSEPSIGWAGNWGMAATAQSKDYVHLTGATLQLPVTPLNVYIELNPNGIATDLQTVAAAGIDSTTVVIVELGDNVPDSGIIDFAAAYRTLMSSVSSRMRLVCLSTFWERSSVDAVLKYECESHGGLYTYIGDIYTEPNNPDRTDNAYSNPFVYMHPHDWGMAHISGRILAELSAAQ